jgi:hypothetical protein
MANPVLQIRLTDEQLAELRKRAEHVGLAPSAWGRQVILDELEGVPNSGSLRGADQETADREERVRLAAENARLLAELKTRQARAKAKPSAPAFTPRAPGYQPKRHAVTCTCAICKKK